jgi:hypothetical protein
MSTWVVCLGCGLRHSTRPDRLCPRCKEPVETGTDAYESLPPATVLRAEEEPISDKAPLGARLAGAVMIVNGLALLAEKGLGIKGGSAIGPSSTSTPAPIIFSFLLGALVLSGSRGAVKVARVLVALSAAVMPLLLLSRGQHVMAALQAAYSTALLLLLFGEAGTLRRWVAAALAAGFFMMEGLGLYGAVSGRYPLGRVTMAGQLEAGPVTKVSGADVRYQLSVPGGSWYLRTAAASHKDNALADRWLVRPDRDTHVMVIVETLPSGSAASMDRFREIVVGNMKKSGDQFSVLDEAPFATALEAGHLVHAKSQLNGQPVEWLIGLYIQPPYIIQVLAFGNGRAFTEVEPELRSIVTSLVL